MSTRRGAPPAEGQDALKDPAQRKALARALAQLMFEREQEEAREEDRRQVDK